ncbi:hypothetical protein [Geodermatophilus sp. DSM 44513]|uniref:hypothetical protein n=1 Tax=Geodermatophilus sp. DSM 44513 TaxID=1528104 RepID=UPI00127E524F|nr:hypothetical protein [Geodermatophilus sp. DSM 44513]WNV74625.1 hypothetical protein RTG05_16755 [Geodermatophilus sp. DSM 44513]
MNNREMATVILAAAFLMFVIVYPKTRASLPPILRQLSHPKIAGPLLAYALSLAGFVRLAARVELWVPDLLADTIFWFFLSGIVWLFSITEAGKEEHLIRGRVLRTLTLAAFFEFFINLKPLALGWEIVLQIFMTFLLMVQVVAGSKPEFRPAKRLVDGLLLLIVGGLLVYTMTTLISAWQPGDEALLIRKLLLPVWLTLSSVPFIFLLALWAAYETLLLRAFFLNDKHRPGWRPLLGLLSALRSNFVDINQFTGHHLRTAVQSGSFREARAAVAQFRAERQADLDRRAAARTRLLQDAGAAGADEDNRRLDRREFAETKAALEWLATSHMGWYGRESRYQADLLERLGDFDRQSLPAEHGIHMRVSKDGQCWYAYRQTITGWFLGIGADGPPPNQWVYAGHKEPRGFPGQGREWLNHLTGSSKEWLPEDKT